MSILYPVVYLEFCHGEGVICIGRYFINTCIFTTDINTIFL